MIKAILVALVLIVPTQVQAQGKQESFCQGLGEVAYNIATARDLEVPIADIQKVLVVSGIPYDVAEALSTTIYYVLKDDNPLSVQESFYRVCMGTNV